MSVLTLPDAKTHLNISGTDHDGELTTMIASAEAVIGARCGPLEAQARSARVDGGTRSLVLPVSPAASLTAVTPKSGDPLSLPGLHLDEQSAVVTFNSGQTFTAAYYDVDWQAGRSVCPDDLLMAVKELLRHMWDTQRGPSRRPGSTASQTTSNTLPGAAYLLPFRVSELIAPHMQPGFA